MNLAVILSQVQAFLTQTWAFLLRIGAVEGAKQIALAGLIAIAEDVVHSITANPDIVSDSDKRAAAVEHIKGVLADQGKTAKDALINLAVELAVNNLKAKVAA